MYHIMTNDKKYLNNGVVTNIFLLQNKNLGT